MAHWSDAFIGLPYIAGESGLRGAGGAGAAGGVRADRDGARACAPMDRSEGLRKSRPLRAIWRIPVATPRDGDAVLMRVQGLWQVGVYFVQGEPWVLHALLNAGMVVAHRQRDLPAYGIKVEGFYRMRCDE